MIKLKINSNFNEKILALIGNRLSHKWFNYKILFCRDALSIYFHDKTLGRISNPNTIIRELNDLDVVNAPSGIHMCKETKDCISDISDKIQNIKKRQNELEALLPSKLHKYVDLNLMKKIKIVFYPLGTDSGFVILPKAVYINSRRLTSDYDSFVDLLAHEIYHARRRRIGKYFIFTVNKYFSKDKFYHEQFGSILEEGIASLIELDISMNYNKNSSINPIELSKTEAYFSVLNIQLISKEFYNDSIKRLLIESNLNIYNLCYVIGYHIAKTVYEYSGLEGINHWSIDHNYKEVIQLYMTACKIKSENPFLKFEVK